MSHRRQEIPGVKICSVNDLVHHYRDVERGRMLFVSELILERIDYAYFEKVEKYLKKCKLGNVSLRECCSTPSDMRRLLRAIKQNFRDQQHPQPPIRLDIRDNKINVRGIEELCKLIERRSIISLAMPEGLNDSNTLLIIRSSHTACNSDDFTIESLDIKGSNLIDKTLRLLKGMIINGMITKHLDLRGCRNKHGLLLRDIDKETLELSLRDNQGLEVEWFESCSPMELARPNRSVFDRWSLPHWVRDNDLIRTAGLSFFGKVPDTQGHREAKQYQREDDMDVSYDENPISRPTGSTEMQHGNFASPNPYGYPNIPMAYANPQQQANTRWHLENAAYPSHQQAYPGSNQRNTGQQMGYPTIHNPLPGWQQQSYQGQQFGNLRMQQPYPPGLQYGNPGQPRGYGMQQHHQWRNPERQESYSAFNPTSQRSNMENQQRLDGGQHGSPGQHAGNPGTQQVFSGSPLQSNEFYPGLGRTATENTVRSQEEEARATNSLGAEQFHPDGDEMNTEQERTNQVPPLASIDLQQRRTEATRGRWNLRKKMGKSRHY